MRFFVVERNFTNGVQKQDKFAVEVGKNVPPNGSGAQVSAAAVDHVWAVASEKGFSHLFQLRQSFNAHNANSESPVSEREPLGFEQLEMLEAELNNQGILIKNRDYCCSLAQHLEHEANVWRWRAQRFGVDSGTLQFNVDLPRYVLWRAEELINGLDEETLGDIENHLQRSDAWTLRFERQGTVLAELHYLNGFAAYLSGMFDEASNRYQRGLNLVLKVLCSKAEEGYTEVPAQNGSLLITLPIGKREFAALLKDYRRAGLR